MDAVTGDAPQPGETPRTEGNPWSFDPDAAWWRGDGDREQAEALAEVAARPRNPRRSTPAPAAGPTEPSAERNPMLGETLDAHAAGAQDAAGELQPRDAAGERQPPDAAGDLQPQDPAGEQQPREDREEPPVPGPDDVMVLPEPQR